MKLSVIIVNYNVRYFLEQCLNAVGRAMQGVDGEVIVVDNNSADGSVAMVRERFPQVTLLVNGENTGFSRANNQGYAVSHGEYVMLLNPDTVVEEDTFRKVIDFLDAHPDAGGVGVHMIDGKGRFLPESKRGLPTPAVAFFKLSGLAALFPRSRLFGRYHLGYLDKNQNHEVEVLSGACMTLRRKALEKTGLLDETFFMYGEDIDLSYRILQAGYKNYYLAGARIIHYKGESTKKSSVNYVLVFYRAMVIFAFKHYSHKNARLFATIIRLAIWLRAGAALAARGARRVFLPAADAALMYAGMAFLKSYWETSVRDLHYPPLFMNVVVPVYIVVWLGSVYLSGGYDTPVRIPRIVRGVLTGTVLILVGYALLPESYRFSRALILIGTAWSVLALSVFRTLLHLVAGGRYALQRTGRKRVIVVAGQEEGNRILSVLQQAETDFSLTGFVCPPGKTPSPQYALGETARLDTIAEVCDVDEIIFSSGDLPAQEIIRLMQSITRSDIEYKIAPPESAYIIGSNSIDEVGSLYLVDINAVNSPANRRNKRLFDLAACLALLPALPVLAFLVDAPGAMAANWWDVVTGRRSWVGLSQKPGNGAAAPRKKSVLVPADAIRQPIPDEHMVSRLEVLYARDYSVATDARILWKACRRLGKRT